MANIRPRLRPRRVRIPLPISGLLPGVRQVPSSSRPDLTRTPEYLRTRELILRILQAQLDARNSSEPDPVVSAFPPGPLADAFGMIEEERRSGRFDEPPGPFFDSIFVRGAMAWAREKGFEERREVQEDGVPFKRYFGPVPLRLAMAFARETALDEAAHIARGRLAGDEAGRFAARMIEKKRQPLFPGAPTSVTGEGGR